MIVRELEFEGKGLFSYMGEETDLSFIVNPVDMDITFNALHGNRKVSTFASSVLGGEVTDEGMRALARVVGGIYGKRWDDIHKTLMDELPDYSYHLIVDESIEDKGGMITDTSNASENLEGNKVSAYNTDDLVENDSSNRESIDKGKSSTDNHNNRVRRTETKGTLGNLYDDRNKLLRYLQDRVNYDIIYTEVGRLVGVLVY